VDERWRPDSPVIVFWTSYLVLLGCFGYAIRGYGRIMLWTIFIILAIVALVLFILGRRRV
jgi:hypothetical protein